MNQVWYAEIELEGKISEAEQMYQELKELLSGNSATIRESPSGQVLVRIALEAGSAQEAARDAMEDVSFAARLLGVKRTITGLELITAKEMERRLMSGESIRQGAGEPN